METIEKPDNDIARLNSLKPGDSIKLEDKQLIEDEHLRDLAEHVIEEKEIRVRPAAVCYMLVYPNISKKKPAKVVKAGRELKYFSGYDYIIQISGELWDMLDRKTQYMLIWHQLLHLNVEYKAKSQEWVFKTRKPEYCDFYEIADREGSEWYKTVQATVGSLYELDPKDEGQVNMFS